jgi:hypothetical protein
LEQEKLVKKSQASAPKGAKVKELSFKLADI